MKQKAYILIFTMAILSLITVFTQQFLRLVRVGTLFDRAMIDREHAEMLALGGIHLAMAQLNQVKPQEKDGKLTPEKETKQKKDELKKFLHRVLPHMNRWQVFPLTEKLDGIDGQVKICITCENGKININQAFDFKKKEFKPLYKKFLSSLTLTGNKKNKGTKFIKELTDYLKTIKDKKVQDISQLQAGIKTSISKLFYEPPERTEKVKLAKANTTLAFQDIFTIWTKTDKLEALFLSDALCSLLQFKRPQAYDAERRKDIFKSVIKKFDPKLNQNDQKYWTIVNPLYKVKSGFKIKNVKLFSSKFEPTTYSVLSSGKVGNVEQRLLAVIEKIKKKPEKDSSKKQDSTNQDSKKLEKKETKQQSPPFKIVRLYWI